MSTAETRNKYYMTQEKLVSLGYTLEQIDETINGNTVNELTNKIAELDKQIKLLKYSKSRKQKKAKLQMSFSTKTRGRPSLKAMNDINNAINETANDVKIKIRKHSSDSDDE